MITAIAAAKASDANGYVCEIKFNILVRVLGPDVRTSESRSNNSIGSGEERYEEFSIDMIPENLRPAATSNRNRFPLFSYQIAFDYTLLLTKSPKDIVEVFFDRRKFIDFLEKGDTPKNESLNNLPQSQIYHNNLTILLKFMFQSERSISSLSKQVYTKKERARYGLRMKRSKQMHNLYSPRVFSPLPISNLLYQSTNHTIYRVQMLDTLELNLIYAEFIQFMNRFATFWYNVNTTNSFNTIYKDDVEYKKKIESIVVEINLITDDVKKSNDTLATTASSSSSNQVKSSSELTKNTELHRLLTMNIKDIQTELNNFNAGGGVSRGQINKFLEQISREVKNLSDNLAMSDRHPLLDDFLKGYGNERNYTKFIEEFTKEVISNCNPLYPIGSKSISSENLEELNYIMTKLRFYDEYHDEYYRSLSRKFLYRFQLARLAQLAVLPNSSQIVDIKSMLGAIFTSFFLRKIKKKDDLNQWKSKAGLDKKYSVYECIAYLRIFVFNKEIDLKTYTSRKFQCNLSKMNLEETETMAISRISGLWNRAFPPPLPNKRWRLGGQRQKGKKKTRRNPLRKTSIGTSRVRW